MHSLEFNYLHDLATTNYNLGNRPDPDSESIVARLHGVLLRVLSSIRCYLTSYRPNQF